MANLPKIPRNWPPEWERGVIKTKNQMGIMTMRLFPTSAQFIDYSKNCNKPVLDIGAAYGIATYGALEAGATVKAIDLSQEHLDILAANVPSEYDEKLQTICGNFPDDIDFPESSVDAILISQVLHFFSGEKVLQSLKKCYQWLTPGGKIFIIVMTPYLGPYIDFVPEYEKKVAEGVTWPGIFDPKPVMPDEWKQQLPQFVHLFEKPIIKKACEDSGFVVESMEYFCYSELEDKYRNNGKEWIGVVAKKV